MSERGLLHDAAEIARLRKANAELEEKLAAVTQLPLQYSCPVGHAH